MFVCLNWSLLLVSIGCKLEMLLTIPTSHLTKNYLTQGWETLILFEDLFKWNQKFFHLKIFIETLFFQTLLYICFLSLWSFIKMGEADDTKEKKKKQWYRHNIHSVLGKKRNMSVPRGTIREDLAHEVIFHLNTSKCNSSQWKRICLPMQERHKTGSISG